MTKLTPRAVAYIGTEEGLVPAAYYDGKKILTWAMGITSASGINVGAYKDNPQPLHVCLRASIDRMNKVYMPAVVRALGDELSENQVAAALSFQWRNGTIEKADWAKDFRTGDMDGAKAGWMNWTDHGRQIPRATRERDLFFDNKWPGEMRTPVYSVSASLLPIKPVLTDILPVLQQIMGGR